MSIQTREYTSRKTGKTTSEYYAVVFDAKQKKAIWSKQSYKTEREAKREEARILRDLEENIRLSGKVTFQEVTNSWADSSAENYANSTFRGYQWYLCRYLLPVFEDRYIDEIEPKHLQTFVNELSKQYSAETVNKNINILSNIFQHAVMLQSVRSNLMDGIKRKKVIVEKQTTWTTRQIQDFLGFDMVKESPYYELFLLSFLTGMRPSEVCGIAVNDFVDNELLTLNRGYDRYGVVSDMKTMKSHRPIQLSKNITELLKNRITSQKHRAELLGEDYAQNDFLFKQKDGAPVNPNLYSKAFKRCLRAFNQMADAKLPDISLYSAARHSFGTNLIVNENIPTSIVSSIMGNSERVLTERYVHVVNSAQSVAINLYSDKILHEEVS
jgi:integrase